MTKPTHTKVVIGMSGGVDSSVAAALLKEKGYEVIGVTMHLWDGENTDTMTESTCCSLSAVEEAKQISDTLGIAHHVLDLRKEFSENVIDYFTNEYINGRTPNPCIACNKFMKFDAMAKALALFDAEYIATGHYARVDYDPISGKYLLKRASADAKDQTYVLYNLTQKQLSRLLLPLGSFSHKEEVRQYADKLGLSSANKPDSQEICFIPDKDYASFIKRRTGYIPREGDFVDTKGNILGTHKGIINYTIGQRKGLGIAFGKPMFVLRIDGEKNQVVLGEQGTEFSNTLYAKNPNFIPFDTIDGTLRASAKVRYSAKAAPAEISLENGLLKVVFDEPQRAITPGQAVVIYDDDIVIGGGTII